MKVNLNSKHTNTYKAIYYAVKQWRDHGELEDHKRQKWIILLTNTIGQETRVTKEEAKDMMCGWAINIAVFYFKDVRNNTIKRTIKRHKSVSKNKFAKGQRRDSKVDADFVWFS